MFDTPRWSQDEDESLSLDYVFDETIRQPGSRGPTPERPAVVALRSTLEGVQSGQRPAQDLVDHLVQLHAKLTEAVRQSAQSAAKRPRYADYYMELQQAYERCLDGLEVMYKAVGRSDSHQVSSGMANFEGAVVDVNHLVANPPR